jgi:hypothetical protein
MPEHLVPPVEWRRVSARQPFHPSDQVALWGFHHQMETIVHETQRMDLPARLPAGFTQPFEKALAISVVLENGFNPVAAIDQVINGSWIFHSQFARHEQENAAIAGIQ